MPAEILFYLKDEDYPVF